MKSLRSLSGISSGAARRSRSVFKPIVEAMEKRLLMTTNSWKAAVSGDWDTASNWSAGHVPKSTEDVVISVAGTYTVTHQISETDIVHSITTSKPINMSAGTLDVTTALTTTGEFSLNGGTIEGATISIGNGGSFVIAGGGLENVILKSGLTVPAGATLTVYQTLNLSGNSLTLAGGSSGAAQLFFEDITGESTGPTLTGGGSVILSGTPTEDYLYAYSSVKPTNIASTVTVKGAGNIYVGYTAPGGLVNSGTITANTSGQLLSIGGGGTLTNSGVITAASGGSLTIASPFTNNSGKTTSITGGGTLTLSGAWVNSGTISQTSSILDLGGTFTATGTITRSGGTVNLTGIYNLKGGTVSFSSTTGSWNLDGGTLENAIIAETGGAGLLLPAGNSGYLNDVTLGGNFAVGANSVLYIYQTLNLKGFSLTLTGGSSGASQLFFEDVTGESTGPTVTGNGSIIFSGTAAEDYFYAYSSNKPLTLTAGSTIHGAGNIYIGYAAPGGFINDGAITANVSGQAITVSGGGTLTNGGTITAASNGSITISSPFNNGSAKTTSVTGGGTLTLSGTWTNAGTISETSSTLDLGGSFTSTGTITRSAGTVNLTGVYNLKNGTITFSAATGSWNLDGGTLENATIVQSGGASLLLPSGNSGYFNDVTLGGNFIVSPNSMLTVYQTLNLKGFSVTLAGGSTGAAQLFFEDVAAETTGPTITGGGSIILADTYADDYLYAYSSAKQLTIAAGDTIAGAGNIYIGYASPGGLLNDGTITANVGKQTLSVLGSGPLTNSGSITAVSGGNLTISSPFTNSSGKTTSITGGGTLTLSGAWVNSGTIIQTSSILDLGGTFSSVGTLTRSAGTVNLTGVFNAKNGTVTFNTATGSWNLDGGQLQNAVIAESGGAGLVLPANNNGYFNDVTLGGNFTVPAGGVLYVYQTLNLKGFTLTLAGGSSGSSQLFFEDVTAQTTGPTLTGGAVILSGTPSEDYVYAYSSAKPTTVATGATIQGAGNIYVGYASPGGLVNDGIVTANISGQTLGIIGSGALTNQGTISITTGATLALSDTNNTNATDGIITGTGKITGDVNNSGIIAAGSPFGTLTITGNLVETTTASIRVELGGTATTSYNKLAISGSATLAGILDIYEMNGFKPASGNSFTVLSYGSKTGTLGLDGESLGGGLALASTIGNTSTSLKAGVAPGDTTAPTAGSFTASKAVANASTFTFSVTYTDNIAIDVTTLKTGNIKVTGPGGYSAIATLVTISKSNNGTPRTVVYSIAAPGGTLNSADNGLYTVTIVAASVKDTKGNAVAAGTIGTFTLALTNK